MIEIPADAIGRDTLRGEIAAQAAHIDKLEAALLPLAEVPISSNSTGSTMDGITRQSVVEARKLLGIRYGLVTDEATVAETMPSWRRWLANARPSRHGRPADICMYYAGYLAGSMYVERRHDEAKPMDRDKPDVAAAALAAAEDGLVYLVQVKMGPSNFRYYAIRANTNAAAAAAAN